MVPDAVQQLRVSVRKRQETAAVVEGSVLHGKSGRRTIASNTGLSVHVVPMS